MADATVKEVNLATLLLDEAIAAGLDQATWASAELPITGVAVIAGDTIVQHFAVKDVAKAVAKAIDVWNTINGTLSVQVVGVPEEAKTLKNFSYNAPINRYSLPDVLRLDSVEGLSGSYVCRNRHAF